MKDVPINSYQISLSAAGAQCKGLASPTNKQNVDNRKDVVWLIFKISKDRSALLTE